MPESRPMPDIRSNCHELRVVDENVAWRILYAVTSDAVVILEVFAKKARKTPLAAMKNAQRRWKRYQSDEEET